MNFSDFLKEVDTKRRRRKRVVVNLLYLLTPLLLMATTFTNERIINQCKDIHHENIVLQEKVIELEKNCATPSSPSLSQIEQEQRKLISQLQNSNASLSRQLTELSGELNHQNDPKDQRINHYRQELNEARTSRDELQRQVVDCQTELNSARNGYQGSMNRILEDNRQLLADKTKLEQELNRSGNTSNEFAEAQKRISILQEENRQLELELERDQKTGRFLNGLRDQLTNLEQRLSDCEGENQTGIPSRAYIIESIGTIPSGTNKPTNNSPSLPSGYYKVSFDGRVIEYLKL